MDTGRGISRKEGSPKVVAQEPPLWAHPPKHGGALAPLLNVHSPPAGLRGDNAAQCGGDPDPVRTMGRSGEVARPLVDLKPPLAQGWT